MPYLAHPRYQRVDGTPLLILFAARNREKKGLDYLQESARKTGLPGVPVVACGGGPRDLSSHTTRYNVVPGWEKGLEKHTFAELVEAHRRSRAGSREQPHIPCLSAGWGRRPWEEGPNPKCCGYRRDRTPAAFGQFLQSAIDWMDQHPEQTTKERLVLVYAWNEFGEGGYIAPTRGDPDGLYLKALRSVILREGGNSARQK